MRRYPAKRHGYVLMPVLLAFGVVGLYVAVLAKYALLDVMAVRREALTSCTEQVAQSVRAWGLAHLQELDRPQELPISELLPRGAVGRALIERGTDEVGNPILVCRISFQVGSQRIDLKCESPLSQGPGAGP